MSEIILNRVKLLMKYDTSKTLSENKLIEQIPNQIQNSSDNVAQGVSQTTYKTGNDYCNRGTYKNLVWVSDNLDGNDTYNGKKGYCRISKERQKVLFDSVGVPSSSTPNGGVFRVNSEDKWYAVYAVWFAQEVEFKIAEKWGWFPEGKCPKSWKTPGRESCKSGNLSRRLSYNEKSRNTYEVTTICYNEDIAYYKPYDKITFDSGIDSSAGLLNSSSIKRYTGHIPSYADVVACYGPNYIDVINKINESPKSAFVNRSAPGMSKGQQSVSAKDIEFKTGLTSEQIHNILAVLELGTAFIPIAGPVISAGIGAIDASLYYAEGDKDMGVFMLLVTLLPELKIASNITKSAKLMKGQKMVEKKILSGKPLKNLTTFEVEFIESLKTLNPSKLNSEIKESIARRADNILQTQGEKLTEQQKAYLKDYSKIYNTEYLAWDLLVAAAGAATTKIGQDILKKFMNLFKVHDVKLTQKNADDIIKALGELDKDTQNVMADAMLDNKKEFETFVNHPEEVVTELKSMIKIKKPTKQNIKQEEIDDILLRIADDYPDSEEIVGSTPPPTSDGKNYSVVQ